MRVMAYVKIILIFPLISPYRVVTGCLPVDNCDTCPPYYSSDNWGDNCEKKCPENCFSGCERTNGYCDHGCKVGFYGQNCSSTCPSGCSETCEQSSGGCYKCMEGLYGKKCDKKCPGGCKGACVLETGTCTACKPGLTGDSCTTCRCGCNESCPCSGWPNCAGNKGTQLTPKSSVLLLATIFVLFAFAHRCQ